MESKNKNTRLLFVFISISVLSSAPRRRNFADEISHGNIARYIVPLGALEGERFVSEQLNTKFNAARVVRLSEIPTIVIDRSAISPTPVSIVINVMQPNKRLLLGVEFTYERTTYWITQICKVQPDNEAKL
jgi:hypothetical protein